LIAMNPTTARRVSKLGNGRWTLEKEDILTTEEPLEVRVHGKSLAVIMRTPGNDIELAAGFLVTEGIVERFDRVGAIEACEDPDNGEALNVVNVTLIDAEFDEERFRRNFYASSSCGICGKASIEAIATKSNPVRGDWRVEVKTLLAMPDKLHAAQRVFAQTGSLHAAGIFDLNGDLIDVAEDVGRHNAVDKVIGRAALEDRLPLDRAILVVSGRISFEITQKALMAGIPCIGAVSGASSLAVELAEQFSMTLAGFLRGDSMVVYHDRDRIIRQNQV